MTKLAAVLIAVSSAFAAPAFAQDGNITLRVDSGSVMTSAGGEYASANTGKQLVVGERIMVNAGSSATALYDGGCAVEFKEPGVYEVPATCAKAAWAKAGGTGTVRTVGIIVGAAAIGAAIRNGDEKPVGPLSTGPNGTIHHF